jgi:Uma2 family endonuclease
MATATEIFHSDVVILRNVPYRFYVHLTNANANRHLKMAYHDGTLEIVSPRRLEHERPSRKLAWIVTTVAEHLGIPYEGTAGTTFRKQGEGIYKGKGKEPDQSFYMASVARLPLDREVDVDAGDPPPDLWIEVDNRASSAGRLPVYAALGVPEVWRYRAKKRTLQFLQLVDGAYQPIDHSLALPILTPALVLEALALGGDPVESEWVRLLREWVHRTIPAPPAGV